MRVAVLGSGNMATGLVRRFRHAGHDVVVYSRNHQTLNALAQAEQASVADSAAQAVRGADAVVLALPFDEAKRVLTDLPLEKGQPVLDLTNPLSADYMSLTIGFETSAAEVLASVNPNASVAKIFNTVFAQILQGDVRDVTTFVASDDARARETAKALAESAGFRVLDSGALKNARYLEPLAGLNIYFGYGAGLGTQIAPTFNHY